MLTAITDAADTNFSALPQVLVFDLGNRYLELLPNQQRTTFARVHVEVREQLDGRITIYYMGNPVPTREMSELRARYGRLAVANRSSGSGAPSDLVPSRQRRA